MTSGNRTSEATKRLARRYASYLDADGRWLLTYQQIADRLGISDTKVVADAVRWGNRNWATLENARDYEDTP